MLDNKGVRSAVAGAVEPVARGLLRAGLSPNALTATTALISSAVAIAFWSRGEFGLGLLAGIPFVFGDLLDGTMARLSGQVSKFGGFLDSVMDRVTDAAILGSLVFYFARQSHWLAVAAGLLAMGAGAIVPYARAKAESLGVVGKTGLMERSDRLAVVAVGAVAAAFGYVDVLAITLQVLAILTSYTVWQRINSVRLGLRDAHL